MTSQIGSEFDYFGAISAYIVDVKKPATSCPYVFFFNGKMGLKRFVPEKRGLSICQIIFEANIFSLRIADGSAEVVHYCYLSTQVKRKRGRQMMCVSIL